MTAERDQRVERDCIHTLYAQGPFGTFVAALVAGLVVVALWSSVPQAPLVGWYALFLLNQLVRIGMIRAFRRENPAGAERLRVWVRRYMASLVLGGLIFGAVAWFMFPLASAGGQVFLMIIFLGMAAGSITGNAYHPPTMRAYVMAMLLPLLARLVVEWTFEHAMLALAIGLYLPAILVFGRNQARLIRQSLAMGYENLDLLDELRKKTELAEAAQHNAEQASLAKSQFFAAASHDLRQPLQALGLFAGSLREVNRDPENAARIDQILTSVDALESLFDELLDISKLDAGYVKPVLSHFAARTLFERLADVHAPVARRNGLELAFHDGGATLYADPVLLERVVGNLLSNALRYTAQGSVRVRCTAEGGRARIEVRDSGQGIPPSEHERIFEEFYQLGNSERDRRKGLGLGLATVRRIARLLDWPVAVSSQPGSGSTFSVEVPAGDPAQIQAKPSVPTVEELDALQGRLIGIVEDERGVRDALTELLRQWRCEVMAAPSGEELARALAAAGRRPDAIIADYRLRHHETGVAAITTVRAACGSELPAMIISGDTTPEIFTAAREHALLLLSKPVRAARLRAALQHLLSDARAPA